MKDLEVNKESTKLYISNSPFFMNTYAIISTGVKYDLNLSWLTKLLIQYDIPILEKLKREFAQEKVIKKLEKEIFEQKMLSENLKREIAA